MSSDRPTPAVTVEELAAVISAGGSDRDWVLIDVRTEPEYRLAHIAETALVISHDELEDRLAELERYRERTIYFVCRSGRRSAYTTELLLANHYPQVFNVSGGVIAWAAAGFVLVRS